MSKTVLPSGRLVILSGPSGVGKTTVVRRLLASVPHLSRSVSATTRPMRPGERDGADYFFLSEEAFARKESAGEFLESAPFLSHRYGTPRPFVEEQLRRGRWVVLAIDVAGADQVRSRFSPTVSFFLLPPSLEALSERLRRRGTDSEEEIARRLEVARREIARKDQYDYVIVNDAVDDAVARIRVHLEQILHGGGSSLLS